MIFTKDFTFLHIPKTGGTFVTKCIKELYTRNSLDLKIHKGRRATGISIPLYPYGYQEHSRQHAMLKHIPDQHKDKPVLSCIRDPFSSYISHYYFGWWQDYPERWFEDMEGAKKKFPTFPDLSFREFVVATNQLNPWIRRNGKQLPTLGFLSLEFLFYFTINREPYFSEGSDAQALVERFTHDIKDVRWIRTSNLAEDTVRQMRAFGHSDERLAFIEKLAPVNVSRKKQDPDELYDTKLREYVMEREQFLISLVSRLQE